MSDVNNAKQTIADKIHQAVSSLLDTEMRLNQELNEAREMIRHLEREVEQLKSALGNEAQARTALETLVSKVADLVGR